jgi:hypothetical protein
VTGGPHPDAPLLSPFPFPLHEKGPDHPHRRPAVADRPRPLPKLSKVEASLPFALTLHKSLVTYIAGEMVEHNMTPAQAALYVFEQARQVPQFAAENADMLEDFDPINNPLTVDDVAAIERDAAGIKRFDRMFNG